MFDAGRRAARGSWDHLGATQGIEFGADGSLWVVTYRSTLDLVAQDALGGRLMRLDPVTGDGARVGRCQRPHGPSGGVGRHLRGQPRRFRHPLPAGVAGRGRDLEEKDLLAAAVTALDERERCRRSADARHRGEPSAVPHRHAHGARSVAALAPDVRHAQRGGCTDPAPPRLPGADDQHQDDHRVGQHVQEERRRLVREERVRDAEEVGRTLEVERQAPDDGDEVRAEQSPGPGSTGRR